jgi:hypothetical protein
MGICNCANKVNEGEIYLDFIESLKIKLIKSEDLMKKLKEKYLIVSKEDKKISVLLNEIFPMIESSTLEYREFSHNYLMTYFNENEKNFYSLCFFCDKESNFKRSFEEITNTNKKKWNKNFSSDKNMINREFLIEIVNEYIKFSTLISVQFLEKITGTKTTEIYLTGLFDSETRIAIVRDLFQGLGIYNIEGEEMIDLNLFFGSDSFKTISDKSEILKMFETYDKLKK